MHYVLGYGKNWEASASIQLQSEPAKLGCCNEQQCPHGLKKKKKKHKGYFCSMWHWHLGSARWLCLLSFRPSLTETQSDTGFHHQEGQGKASMQNFAWALKSGVCRTPTHISLAKESHKTKPDIKTVKKENPSYWLYSHMWATLLATIGTKGFS